MPTKSKTKADEAPRGPRAVLIELDNLAFSARAVAYDVLKRILAEKSIALGIGPFAQHCVVQPARIGVPALAARIGQGRLAGDEVLARFQADFKVALASPAHRPQPAVQGLVEAARRQGARIGLVSLQDADTSLALAQKLGMGAGEATVLPSLGDDRHFATVDAWLKLAKETGVIPELCLAFATCSSSCRGALSAGMFCVAVPDAYTGFQDFGGADAVADSLDTGVLREAFALLDI